MADRFMQQQIKLYGEAGSLEIDIPYEGAAAGAVIRVARNQDEWFQTLETPASYWGEVSRSEPFGVFTQHSAGCRAFIDAILGNHPATPTFYDGYKAQQVVEAAIEAHRSGQWVAIKSSL
jgi:predicted dehydrogenase